MSDIVATPYDDHLIDAATRVFLRHGFCGATLERVAAESGLPVEALRRQGVTRNTLLEAIATRSARRGVPTKRVHGP